MPVVVKTPCACTILVEVEAPFQGLEFVDYVTIAAEDLAGGFHGEPPVARSDAVVFEQGFELSGVLFDDISRRRYPPVEDEVAVDNGRGGDIDNGGGVEAVGEDVAVAALHAVDAVWSSLPEVAIGDGIGGHLDGRVEDDAALLQDKPNDGEARLDVDQAAGVLADGAVGLDFAFEDGRVGQQANDNPLRSRRELREQGSRSSVTKSSKIVVGWGATVSAQKFLLPMLWVALLVGCGEPERGTVPQIASARAERVVEDGAATLKSTITVNFDRPFQLAPSRLALSSQFELEVPQSGSPSELRRVLVRKATLAGASNRQVILEVDALIPQGSVVKVAKKAFRVNEPGELRAEVESALTPEFTVLASTTLAPTRVELFADPKNPPATAADRDPAGIRRLLEDYLALRGASTDLQEQVLRAFESLPVEIVSHPKIRAALAALTGTFGEPVLDSLFTANNCTEQPAATIAFQPPPGGQGLVAQVTRSADGRRVVSISPDLEGERFEHLMPLLVHETIHCDERSGIFEEVAATAFDTFFYLHLLAIDPSLVEAGTRLARDFNLDTIALINSGRRVPESVGILRSVGVNNALPGSSSEARSFGDLVAKAYERVGYDDSPAEPLAVEYVEILADQAGMQPGNPFDIPYLDELLGRALDPRVLAAAIIALDLRPEN